jgi:hypothetical protein
MSTWQLIETAPKDGTKIVLMNPSGLKYYAPCQWSLAGDISEDGFWLWWQAEPEWLTEVQNPTHWMLLDVPPE